MYVYSKSIQLTLTAVDCMAFLFLCSPNIVAARPLMWETLLEDLSMLGFIRENSSGVRPSHGCNKAGYQGPRLLPLTELLCAPFKSDISHDLFQSINQYFFLTLGTGPSAGRDFPQCPGGVIYGALQLSRSVKYDRNDRLLYGPPRSLSFRKSG